MFQQRTWILQRTNIELLRECQRFVLDQFSEKLSLTQKDLIEKIFYFSSQSQNKPFHAAVERLKHSLVEAAFDITQLPGCDELAEPERSKPVKELHAEQAESMNENQVKVATKRTYRGRSVLVETPPTGVTKNTDATIDSIGGKAVDAKKSRRIYRGRAIEG